MKQKLHGGKGDKAKPSDFDPAEVKKGVKHEMEHTKDRSIAMEICLDHLSENPHYYSDLEKAKLESIIENILYDCIKL